MTKIDQFESVFNSAAKDVFHLHAPTFKKLCIVTDLKGYDHKQFVMQIRSYLEVLGDMDELSWLEFDGETSHDLETILKQVEEESPDLICTYRNLHSGAWRWPYSLGEHLHVLTQATNIPVLVLPRPDQDFPEDLLQSTQTVMAVTDHISGDEKLVNYAVHLTAEGGTLHLAHVEPEETFETYIDLISKIPALDTDVAREALQEQILKQPADYVESTRQELEAERVSIEVNPIVALGDPLTTYQFLLEEHNINLLVLYTKDDNQHAMHNLAYTLAVELRDVPLLML